MRLGSGGAGGWQICAALKLYTQAVLASGLDGASPTYACDDDRKPHYKFSAVCALSKPDLKATIQEGLLD